MAKKNIQWKIIYPDGEAEAIMFAENYVELAKFLRERYGSIAGIKVQKVGGKRK